MGLRTFSFDGISSDTFNLFVTEAIVHNAPERAVEMLEIPGRNGFYALDQGRFNNTEVTYHVVVDGSDDADFSEEIADVREWLCSGTGYKRLEDDYNPNEYRMAVYRNGFETDEAFWNGAEFDITFDCKPQRWLTSGETATAVANNGTLTNPTRFDAEPLLEVKGYGGIEFNGYEIDVVNANLGNIAIADGDAFSEASKTYSFDAGLFNPGDVISVSGRIDATNIIRTGYTDLVRCTTQSASDSNANFTTASPTFPQSTFVELKSPFVTTFNDSVVAGTDKTITNTATITANYLSIDYGSGVATFTMTQTIVYDASDGTITVTISTTKSTTVNQVKVYWDSRQTKITIIGNSTVSALGNPTYIDCEIGEAYMIKNGDIVSCNQAVTLGSDLPKLASGTNTITFDNTVTELKIHPRWWRV